jgi:hypothetical protein
MKLLLPLMLKISLKSIKKEPDNMFFNHVLYEIYRESVLVWKVFSPITVFPVKYGLDTKIYLCSPNII